MLGIIEFGINKEYGYERSLCISRGDYGIAEPELRIIFKRKKGEKVFRLHFSYATLTIGNKGYVSYNYEYSEYNATYNIPTVTVVKRMYLNWDSARGG
jgi:hypothetical protein